MNEPNDKAIIDRIGLRFQRSNRGYARGKLRWDPMFATVAPLLATSPHGLLDIGCGLGLLGHYLRGRGFRAPYRGLDLDARKIQHARAAADADMDFTVGSATDLPEFEGNVALLDVLHYMTAEDQQRALESAAARVAPGGILLIRNVLRDGSWRFRTTLIEERLASLIGWMRTPTQHFPERAEIEPPLQSRGLMVNVAPLWGRTPFNSYLIAGRRGAAR